jgi:tetratricopeptide (TPR) repeat protein
MTPTSQSKNSSDILIDQIIQKALNFIQADATADAIEQLFSILAIQNDHHEANYYLGLLTLNNFQPSDSLQYFETALDKRPDHGPYWLAYINALEQSGQPDIARKTLKLALQSGLEGDEVKALATRLKSGKEVDAEQILTDTAYPEQQQKNVINDNTPDQKTIDNLISLYQQGKLAESEKLARSILVRFPDHGFSWKLLGAVLNQTGRLEEAISAMQRATVLLPQDPETFNNLGVTLKAKGALDESESALRQALTLNSNFSEAHNNLGVTLLAQGRLTEGEESFRKAVHIQPDYIEAYCNLGTSLKDQGHYKDSENYLKHALELNPSYAEGYNNLGNLYQGRGRLFEAEKVLRKALELKPDFAKAYYNLGNVFQSKGNLQASEQCYLDALKLKPAYADAFDALLFISNYHADKSAGEIFELYHEYDKKFGIPYHRQWQLHDNDCLADRPLKIGYVSPAFYNHPVFNFLEPLLTITIRIDLKFMDMLKTPLKTKQHYYVNNILTTGYQQ